MSKVLGKYDENDIVENIDLEVDDDDDYDAEFANTANTNNSRPKSLLSKSHKVEAFKVFVKRFSFLRSKKNIPALLVCGGCCVISLFGMYMMLNNSVHNQPPSSPLHLSLLQTPPPPPPPLMTISTDIISSPSLILLNTTITQPPFDGLTPKKRNY